MSDNRNFEGERVAALSRENAELRDAIKILIENRIRHRDVIAARNRLESSEEQFRALQLRLQEKGIQI